MGAVARFGCRYTVDYLGMFVKGYIDVEAGLQKLEVLVGWLLHLLPDFGAFGATGLQNLPLHLPQAHTRTDNASRIWCGIVSRYGGYWTLTGCSTSPVVSNGSRYLSRNVIFSRHRSDDGIWMDFIQSGIHNGPLRTWTLLTTVGSIAVGFIGFWWKRLDAEP